MKGFSSVIGKGLQMKSSYLVHGFWGAACVASFTIGSQFFTDDDTSSRAIDPRVGSGALGQSVRVSSRQDVGSGTSERDAGARSEIRTVTGGTTKLSDAGLLALAEEFKKGKGPIERRLAFSKLLENLTAENAKTVREQLLHLSERSDEWREFHYAWGALAGDVAVLNGKETKERDMSATFAGWASSDPVAALAWFDSLSAEERGNGNDLKWGAVFGLADADPKAATNFAVSRLEGGDKDAGRMMDLIARNVLRAGNPSEAAQWTQGLPEGEIQEAAVRRVAEEYAEEDAPGAVSWLKTLPDGKAQERGLDRAFSEWAREDPVAAATELNTMTPSPARDSAINGYVSRLAWEDPQAAIEWAGSVNDPKARELTTVEAGRAFYRKDQEAAQLWLASSGLSVEAQKKVTDRGRRR